MTISTNIITRVKCECFCILPYSIHECNILGRKQTSVVETHKDTEKSLNCRLAVVCFEYCIYRLPEKFCFKIVHLAGWPQTFQKLCSGWILDFLPSVLGRDLKGTSQIAEIAQKHLSENWWRKGHLNAGIASPGRRAWCQPLSDSLPEIHSQHGCAKDE